ncbi:MAG: prolyl oligopeptidase family serine peptidase [Cyclobacteriaceae bacterium]
MHLTKPAKILFTGILFLLFINSVILAQEAEVSFTEHFGQKVDHPYLWLEDVESDTVQSWIKKQEDYKWEHFNRSDFKKILNQWNYNSGYLEESSEQYSVRVKFEEYYPPVLSIKVKDVDKAHWPRLKASDFKRTKGDRPSIVNVEWDDGLDVMVVFVSHSFGDWLELIVFDLKKMETIYTIPGVMTPWVSFKGYGFVYERYDTPDSEIESIRENQRICYHTIWAKPDDDKLLFYNQDKSSKKTFDILKPKDSDWLIILHPFKNGTNWLEAVSVIDLEDPLFKTKTIAMYDAPFELEFDYVSETDTSILFRSNMLSPQFQLLSFDISGINKYQVFVNSYKEVLHEAKYLGKGFYGLEYMDGNKFFGIVIDSLGNDRLSLPLGHGAALDYYINSDGIPKGYIKHYHANSMSFELNLDLDEISYDVNSYKPINLYDYEISVTSYEANDGEIIPITIVHEKEDFKRDGSRVALIDVYGGYGMVQEPNFSMMRRYFLGNGGVLAIPGVRGSGARGTEWAAKGRDLNKQNTISDIISAAEFVISEGYTSQDKLFLEGGSHGGFAVSAAAIQRPDLFEGVMVSSGSLDLIRRINQTTGYSELNRIEYGDPEDSVSFQSRLRLSPIHSLHKGVNYPSFLIVGGVNDSRVPIHNSLRFYAQLQDYSANQFNFLHLTNGGHGVYANPYEVLSILSFKLKFIYELTGEKMWR